MDPVSDDTYTCDDTGAGDRSPLLARHFRTHAQLAVIGRCGHQCQDVFQCWEDTDKMYKVYSAVLALHYRGGRVVLRCSIWIT